MNVVNWGDAPEWAIQVCKSRCVDEGMTRFWSDGGTKYSYVNDIVKDVFFHDIKYTREYCEFIIVGIKPVIDLHSKPVFTQEMEEAGVIPPVGSKVILIEDTGFYSAQHQVAYGEDGGSIVEVVGHAVRPDNSDISVTLFNGKGFVTINPEWVKPLDNRTPKQKAVDVALKLMGFSGGGNIESDLSKIYDMWHNKITKGE